MVDRENKKTKRKKKERKERKIKIEMRERYEIDRQQKTNWSKESVADRKKIK